LALAGFGSFRQYGPEILTGSKSPGLKPTTNAVASRRSGLSVRTQWCRRSRLGKGREKQSWLGGSNACFLEIHGNFFSYGLTTYGHINETSCQLEFKDVFVDFGKFVKIKES
jgi:hypothetical protein